MDAEQATARSAAGAGQRAPRACHVMAKPSGSVCNLDCTYCFYLEKEKLYPGRAADWRMSVETLELYVRQYIESQDAPTVNFAWQGGEPTLMGLDFFRRAVALQRRHAGGKAIANAFQTNGILIDDEWAEFLAANQFLVGLSVDGPQPLHDRYRRDKAGRPTFARVAAAMRTLRRHGVEFNTLTAVQADNAAQPLAVYEFLRAEGSGFMQFIPIVERAAAGAGEQELRLVEPDHAGSARLTRWSVSPAQYGRFLVEVFDQWVRRDVGQVFVQMFEVALSAWLGQAPCLCLFAPTCGDALVLEHNGDLYVCDHFVYPRYRLGNIHQHAIGALLQAPALARFGENKLAALTRVCRACEYRFACNGGCPKHRFSRTPAGERGHNYLCGAYRSFFAHADPYLRAMADLLRQGLPAAGVMELARCPAGIAPASGAGRRRPGRNDPCPCGSGRKYKDCCARPAVRARVP